MTSTTFDPRQYKITTHAQWEDAAEAWHRWGLLIEDWLGPATERMLDAARITTGNSVLDVAAGAGGQSLSAARRVGPTGRVLATDISPTILEYAEKAASDAGLATITTRELDGEHLDVEEGGFDAVISRVGLIYFPDQQAALADMRRALRPGGRLSAVVYSTADRNGFFSVPVGIIRRRCPVSLARSVSGAPRRRKHSCHGWVPRRRCRGNTVAAPDGQCGGVRRLRARVVRRAASNALWSAPGRPGRRVDRDQPGSRPVRGV